MGFHSPGDLDTDVHFLTVMEAGSLRSGWQQVGFWQGPPFWFVDTT